MHHTAGCLMEFGDRGKDPVYQQNFSLVSSWHRRVTFIRHSLMSNHWHQALFLVPESSCWCSFRDSFCLLQATDPFSFWFFVVEFTCNSLFQKISQDGFVILCSTHSKISIASLVQTLRKQTWNKAYVLMLYWGSWQWSGNKRKRMKEKRGEIKCKLATASQGNMTAWLCDMP